MPSLRVVQSNERPPIEVDYFSRDLKFHTDMSANAALDNYDLFGDRYWVFNDPEKGLETAEAISKLVIGNTVSGVLRPYDLGAWATCGDRRENRTGESRSVAYLSLVIPSCVVFYGTGEDTIERLILTTNDDLAMLGSQYQLPLQVPQNPKPAS